MVAQVYETSRVNFLTTFIEGRFQMEFFIGGAQPLGIIYDPKNSFINLGGDPSSPLTYKYQDTGLTEFNFNIQAPNYIMEDVGIINLGSAIWEMWIDGDKPYYYYYNRRDSNIFDRTVSVKATKDGITKFKFRLTVEDIVTDPPTLNKYYFEGSTNTIYSSITAKFIPETTSPQSPIIVLGTTQEIVPGVTHIIKSTTQCSLSLPATYPLGVSTKIISYNDNGYKILQKDGQVIKAVGRTTTIGTGGSMTFNDKYSQVNIDCVDANKTFVLNNITGGFLTV